MVLGNMKSFWFFIILSLFSVQSFAVSQNKTCTIKVTPLGINVDVQTVVKDQTGKVIHIDEQIDH